MKLEYPHIRPAVGGTGLHLQERLLRLVGHSAELDALLEGGLSCTQVAQFPDPLEAAAPEADRDAAVAFWGNRLPAEHQVTGRRQREIRESTYVSCWHRVSALSSAEKLVGHYAFKKSVCWAVVTSVSRMLGSFHEPMGLSCYLDVLPVRYLPGEDSRLRDARNGEAERCWWPALEFKRPEFEWEAEARFVLVDHADITGSGATNTLRRTARPPRRFVAVRSDTFVEAIIPLDAESHRCRPARPLAGRSIMPPLEEQRTRTESLSVLLASLLDSDPIQPAAED